MSLSLEDAQYILGQLTSPEVLDSDFVTLKKYFTSIVIERNLKGCLFNVCHLIARLLYLNYNDFLPKTSQQIAALFFLFSVYDRYNNPFLGFIFDVINIDSYRTILPANKKQYVSCSNKYEFAKIEQESETLSLDLINNFEMLHRELMEELENHETNLRSNPISISLFTAEDFPSIPAISKQVIYSLISGFFKAEILSLTPELLSTKTARFSVRSRFDGRSILEIIKKQESLDDWKSFKLPFCPIYVFENFFSDRQREQKELLEMILEDIENKANDISPELIRLEPPIAPIQEHEFVFPYPSMIDSLELEWDNSILEKDENKDVKELRNTLKKAFSSNFYPNQTQKILTRLRKYEKLVFEIELNPDRFMELVENNPSIATEIIVIFVKNCNNSKDQATISYDQIGEYLMKIISVDISVQSMEVINGLSSRIVLPTQFMHIFISHSIKSCDNIKDKTLQCRLARLNCVFLQSLITNKIINVGDILSEVQMFCVGFFSLKEATSLYRMLRSEIHSNSEEKLETLE